MENSVVEYRWNQDDDALDEEAALVTAAQEDLRAAGQLYDLYYERIFRYIYHSTLNVTLTEDLTANTFLSALQNLKRYRWQRVPLAAWLYRIATNELRMQFRRQRRGNKTDFELVQQGPEDHLVDQETTQQLYQALLQLKPKYREVIILRYFEDRTISELSLILERRQGTVKSQLSRGLSQLQGILMRTGALPD